MKGLFVTFEGGEGAGKTTLIEGIYQAFIEEGREVLKTREPGGTPLGEEIRKILLEPRNTPVSPYAELSLFLASRSQHIREKIQPALHKGYGVLCDRFNDSTIAYQGKARGLGTEKVRQMCEYISEGLIPHVTFYLDIDPKIGLKRTQNRHTLDRIEAEKIEFHQKIREGFLEIAQKEPKRFLVVDALMTPQEILKHALNLLQPWLK